MEKIELRGKRINLDQDMEVGTVCKSVSGQAVRAGGFKPCSTCLPGVPSGSASAINPRLLLPLTSWFPLSPCHTTLQLSGRVVWTGTSSMDLAIELEQAGQQQLSALFTFVAREPLTGAPCRIPSVLPQTPEVGFEGLCT